MTVKYELTKLYKERADIQVDAVSYRDFLTGLTNTLEHIVQYENQKVIVNSKPKLKDYQHYIPMIRLINGRYVSI